MDTFTKIFERAAKRKGGPEALEQRLPSPKTTEDLAALSDDRYLAAMTKRVFQAGFVWRVIDTKWPDFERVFQGFDPARLAILADEQLSETLKDKGIVRNWPKIKTIRDNARFVMDVSRETGSFGRFIADWPPDDMIGLWDVLKKRGSRLGGNSGPFFLRSVGKDTFILVDDVVTALQEQGVITGNPTSKKDRRAVQDAFNIWHEESGRPYCQISRTLACTVGENYQGLPGDGV